MKENIKKYAELLITKCINLKENEPLYISIQAENFEFARILNNIALKYTKDIYIDYYDEIIKHDTLTKLDFKDIKNHYLFNKTKMEEYAKKNAAFLFLESPNVDLFSDISSDKINESVLVNRNSRKTYNDKQLTYKVAWCIACIPTKSWANKIFKNDINSIDKLWELIFKICLVNDDYKQNWDKQIKENENRSILLNKYNFKKLHYINSLGTNLTVELSKDSIWCGAKTIHENGKEIIVNMPTYENFTSPIKDKTNGIVYSSKPLVYGGCIIDEFSLTFKDGKVIDIKAKKGLDILKKMINTDENSCMLGECALVDYNSPISLTNKIFYTTLYDENASCHLALGEGFNECIKDGNLYSKEMLNKKGINTSKIHVDFMIGTSDLTIIGTTFDNKEYKIFENGNFILK